jgi:hypothetical protein
VDLSFHFSFYDGVPARSARDTRLCPVAGIPGWGSFHDSICTDDLLFSLSISSFCRGVWLVCWFMSVAFRALLQEFWGSVAFVNSLFSKALFGGPGGSERNSVCRHEHDNGANLVVLSSPIVFYIMKKKKTEKKSHSILLPVPREWRIRLWDRRCRQSEKDSLGSSGREDSLRFLANFKTSSAPP